ncbi:23S rRNA (guanosine(2251)-2'-O)-methyltransferase RlmB [Lacibacterium aquatile]|uniref:23S rRNA (Guanosine(2251)-2'-O)-methyltransferase RlmB n=1 Tax=Lacibacterium aquatile TaxID=1168082 RepID=A0ABW5DYN3_9PROT
MKKPDRRNAPQGKSSHSPSGPRGRDERPARANAPAPQAQPAREPRPEGRPDARTDRGPRPNKGSGKGGSGQPWLYGHHAVRAALANPNRKSRRLLLTEEAARDWKPVGSLRPEVVERITIESVLPGGAVHQGIALLADPLEELGLEDVLFTAAPDAVFVLLDQVTDPHNVGAILRSSAVFGAACVIQTDRHAATATATLAKAASGALDKVPLVRVVNLARTIRQLQEEGFFVVGLDGQADKTLDEAVMPGRLALVMGAEGDGLRRLTVDSCDTLGRLPAADDFASLNVSNAAAVALYIASKR